jgi:hypothetical protein
MDLFDTLTWVEILEKTTFLGTPILIVLRRFFFSPYKFFIFWKNNFPKILASIFRIILCRPCPTDTVYDERKN